MNGLVSQLPVHEPLSLIHIFGYTENAILSTANGRTYSRIGILRKNLKSKKIPPLIARPVLRDSVRHHRLKPRLETWQIVIRRVQRYGQEATGIQPRDIV